jgi:hypothetical protein
MSAILSAAFAASLFGGQLKKKKIQDKFHPNQITTGDKIVSNFATKNYCMLFAQMQSGKTATALYSGFTMLFKGMVSNIVIFSGSHDLFLQKQWEKSKIELSQDFEKRMLKRGDCEDEYDIAGALRERTTVVWRQNIKKQKRLFTDNTLIIWDESHYGSTQKQTIDKEFSELLGDAFRGDTTTLKENKIFVLTVTATRCAEQSRHYYNPIARENWFKSFLEPDEGYFGVKDYYEAGLYNVVNVKDAQVIENVIRTNIDVSNPKIFVIRTSGTATYNGIKTLLHSYGDKIEYREYNASNNDIETYNTLFKQKPTKPRVVIVKGLFRMGCVIDKTYIGAVWETAKDPKHNTILQGLPGRVCGYGDFPKNIRVYIPSLKPIQEYLGYIEHIKGLTHTQHINKEKQNKSRFTPVTFPVLLRPQDFPTRDEDYSFNHDLFFSATWNNDQKQEIIRNPQVLKHLIERHFKYHPEQSIVAEHEKEEFDFVFDTATDKDLSFRCSHKTDGSRQYQERIQEICSKIGKDKCSFINLSKINILKITQDYNGIPRGSIIVMVCTDRKITPPISRTKGTSVHDEIKITQESTTDHCNGIVTYEISKETRNNPVAFKKELGRYINFNKKGGWHATEHKENITFSDETYPNGIDSIIKELAAEYCVKITIKKFPGRAPVGFTRYRQITWEPKKQRK